MGGWGKWKLKDYGQYSILNTSQQINVVQIMGISSHSICKPSSYEVIIKEKEEIHLWMYFSTQRVQWYKEPQTGHLLSGSWRIVTNPKTHQEKGHLNS